MLLFQPYFCEHSSISAQNAVVHVLQHPYHHQELVNLAALGERWFCIQTVTPNLSAEWCVTCVIVSK